MPVASFTGGGLLADGLCFEDTVIAPNLSAVTLSPYTPGGPPYSIKPFVGGGLAFEPIEAWMLGHDFAAFPALELLRRTLLENISDSDKPIARVRTVILTAYSTELHTIFRDLLDLSEAFLSVRLCLRKRLIDIDAKLAALLPYYPEVYNELQALGVPTAYRTLLKAHLTSAYYKDRVAANAAIVLLSAVILSGA